MTSICENIQQIKSEIGKVELVVVSKYRSLEELHEVYACGHRIFGENRVQELVSKQEQLPADIQWHLIGHLQSNKVKYIASFVHLIHSVDSLKLLQKIDQEAAKHKRVIPFLFQMHIATEESKFGLDADELKAILRSEAYKVLKNVRCRGLMGMASFTDKQEQLHKEFGGLYKLYTGLKDEYDFDTLSMGMSGDYTVAVEKGSTTIRVGSKIFT